MSSRVGWGAGVPEGNSSRLAGRADGRQGPTVQFQADCAGIRCFNGESCFCAEVAALAGGERTGKSRLAICSDGKHGVLRCINLQLQVSPTF